MPVLGVTGGIATGKSTFTKRMVEALHGTVFDADQAARTLLNQNEAVKEAVRKAFGEQVMGSDGEISRIFLREIVFQDASMRKVLEGILHPAIREQWQESAKEASAGLDWLLIDIPLLYETGVDGAFTKIVVVACSAATQRERLLGERGLQLVVAEGILAAQLPLSDKMKKADYVVWSDAPVLQMDEQVKMLANSLML